MTGAYASPEMLLTAALGLALAFGPVVGLVVAHRSIGRLRAAAWLVVWGAVMLAAEHGNFALSGSLSRSTVVSDHIRFHLFMAGGYTLIGAAMVAVVGWTLLGQGRREGWLAVALALVAGVAFELLAGRRIFAHGLPPDSIPVGSKLSHVLIPCNGF